VFFFCEGGTRWTMVLDEMVLDDGHSSTQKQGGPIRFVSHTPICYVGPSFSSRTLVQCYSWINDPVLILFGGRWQRDFRITLRLAHLILLDSPRLARRSTFTSPIFGCASREHTNSLLTCPLPCRWLWHLRVLRNRMSPIAALTLALRPLQMAISSRTLHIHSRLRVAPPSN
jgi:hypothetical protein